MGTDMTDLSSYAPESAGRPGPPYGPDASRPDDAHQDDQADGSGDGGRADAEEPDDTGDRTRGDSSTGGASTGSEATSGSSAPDQDAKPDVLPEFVDDPIVPLRLRLPGMIRHTLYHPGWYGIEDAEESQAFLGVPGEVLYGFEKLTQLVDYLRTGVPTGLAPGPDLTAVRNWSAQEYAHRLCDYDMVAIPELANGELSADEQGSVGSMLAVGLDLMDFLRIENEHAEALRQDGDISKLASGDEVLSIFAAGRHRQHVVEMIDTHWAPCMAAIAERIAAPKAGS